MSKEENRFVVTHKEGSALVNSGYRQILVDKETGVNYLVFSAGYGTTITPLLNADGKPIVTRIL